MNQFKKNIQESENHDDKTFYMLHFLNGLKDPYYYIPITIQLRMKSQMKGWFTSKDAVVQ